MISRIADVLTESVWYASHDPQLAPRQNSLSKDRRSASAVYAIQQVAGGPAHEARP
jgi:hypothetical protein